MGQKGLISVSTFSVAKEYNFSRIDDDIILFDNFGKLPFKLYKILKNRN